MSAWPQCQVRGDRRPVDICLESPTTTHPVKTIGSGTRVWVNAPFKYLPTTEGGFKMQNEPRSLGHISQCSEESHTNIPHQD